MVGGFCFYLRGGFGASYKNKLGKNSYEPFLCDFLLHIKHLHPTQQTSGQILEIPRDTLFSSCAGRPVHSHFQYLVTLEREGEACWSKSISPLDYLTAATGNSMKYIYHTQSFTHKPSALWRTFSESHRALKKVQLCGNEQLVLPLPAG